MIFSRTELLLGKDAVNKLKHTRVLIAGLGGVGSYALEALVRAGIGNIFIVDHDIIDTSNINRQLLALHSTLDIPKVDVAYHRACDINPDINIIKYHKRIEEHIDAIISSGIDYAIDAIDEINPKVDLITSLYNHNITFISCMGAARSFDPSLLHINDISKTSYCPLARIIRKKLKLSDIYHGVHCLYSQEHLDNFKTINNTEKKQKGDNNDKMHGKRPLGSLSYMPGIMGLTAASFIIRKIINK